MALGTGTTTTVGVNRHSGLALSPPSAPCTLDCVGGDKSDLFPFPLHLVEILAHRQILNWVEMDELQG